MPDPTFIDHCRNALEALEEILADGRPWREKKAVILGLASEDQKLAISEFAAWFEEVDE